MSSDGSGPVADRTTVQVDGWEGRVRVYVRNGSGWAELWFSPSEARTLAVRLRAAADAEERDGRGLVR